jgi:hypothetical protein
MAEIKVAKRVSSYGNQVFVFRLANGTRVKIEFCPPMSNPEGNASCAVVSFTGGDGKRLPIGVNEHSSEKKMMRSPCLWFTTDEEEAENRRMLAEELDALMKAIPPQFLEEAERRGKEAGG